MTLALSELVLIAIHVDPDTVLEELAALRQVHTATADSRTVAPIGRYVNCSVSCSVVSELVLIAIPMWTRTLFSRSWPGP